MIALLVVLVVTAASGWGLAGFLAATLRHDRSEREAARAVDAARLARLGRSDQRARR